MPLYSPPAVSDTVPVGTITPFGAASAPSAKWLVCDGSAVSRTTYSDLFTLLSTTYGAGNGSTTFNLPDLRGRHAVGQGTHVDVDTLGESDGEAVGNRRPKHKHTVNDSGHSHTVNDPGHTHGALVGSNGGPNGFSSAAPLGTEGGATRLTASGTTGITNNSNTTGVTVGPQTTAATDSPAYLVLQYIIRALA